MKVKGFLMRGAFVIEAEKTIELEFYQMDSVKFDVKFDEFSDVESLLTMQIPSSE